ncbi:Retrovirus-related Pol polyprotein from transposon RE2 [Vitis vinifera]|uniref:Retrovirus-related Pol polyprotein from transposon RE2 n=1 Tax=Vitis vinifera TaxID=29760 RepID=A0A438GRB6_VITVI|nr:Retrovirus-related Pol polyprotein from transposon RE2 [Vitis vinifera]
MQSIKTRADELVALGKPLDQEDLIEKVLEGLDENYQSIIDAVNGRDSTISFDELHEKLINKELSLRNKISPSPLPASAHATNVRFTPWSVTNRTPRLPGSTSAPTQGHVVSRCPLFRQQFPQVQPPSRPGNSSQSRPPAPWQAQANVTTTIPPNTTWLLDSGASHHGRTKDGVYEWPLSTTQSRPLIAFLVSRPLCPSGIIGSALVEKFFNRPIITLYSDNGGEYQALSSFLTINGVSHLTSPPHTPEHNGYSERRHRHIVETALDVSAILGFAHTHPTNSSLVPPLASLSGTLPLKVPIYVLTHPPLVYTLPVMSALLSQSFTLSLLILLFLAPLHPPSLNGALSLYQSCHTIREYRLCSPIKSAHSYRTKPIPRPKPKIIPPVPHLHQSLIAIPVRPYQKPSATVPITTPSAYSK